MKSKVLFVLCVVIAGVLLSSPRAMASVEDDLKAAVKKFAPTVYLHDKESYFPASVEFVLNKVYIHADSKAKQVWLDSFEKFNPKNKLDNKGHVLHGASAYIRPNYSKEGDKLWNKYVAGMKPKKKSDSIEADMYVWAQLVDVHIAGKKEKAWELIYKFFYTYNGTNRTGSPTLKHEGDWEGIHIWLSEDLKTVLQYQYNQHKNKIKYKPSDKTVKLDDTHPKVYSAKQTHASYTTAKSNQDNFDETSSKGSVWEPWKNDRVVLLGYRSVTNKYLTDWYRWKGKWGSSKETYIGTEKHHVETSASSPVCW